MFYFFCSTNSLIFYVYLKLHTFHFVLHICQFANLLFSFYQETNLTRLRLSFFCLGKQDWMKTDFQTEVRSLSKTKRRTEIGVLVVLFKTSFPLHKYHNKVKCCWLNTLLNLCSAIPRNVIIACLIFQYFYLKKFADPKLGGSEHRILSAEL